MVGIIIKWIIEDREFSKIGLIKTGEEKLVEKEFGLQMIAQGFATPVEEVSDIEPKKKSRKKSK